MATGYLNDARVPGRTISLEGPFRAIAPGRGISKIRSRLPRRRCWNKRGGSSGGIKMPDGLMRLTLSRGVGVRGYSPAGAKHPVVVMTLHPTPGLSAKPPFWKIVTSSFRLPAGEALAHYDLQQLPQILARAEAEARGADEALLLNTDGHAVEGSGSNVFGSRAER